MPDRKSKLLTIQQVADALGVNAKTLRRWEAKGVLIAKRTEGNQRRYTLQDVEILKNRPKAKKQASQAVKKEITPEAIIPLNPIQTNDIQAQARTVEPSQRYLPPVEADYEPVI